MEAGAPQPRAVLAREVARRLIYLSEAASPGLSPVRAAKDKLDELLARKQIPESEYRQLFSLLETLEGCDLDRCERTDDLVHEVTMNLTVWPEAFSDQELERLHGLL